ncbi:hypothetical protein GQ607_014359 [Colletotrichum asianum]|uniref:Uncharacterized protein n=1 Tax=Colletotrichum asianum TaxID=702518 RepID=A0A8H3W3D3_9PEZI|nr:hypothetical protein GQ607_014359 [Colletotrichum asianum]
MEETQTDIIAQLYPVANVGERTTKAIKASSRYAPPLVEITEQHYDRNERQSTEPPVEPSASAYDYLPRLELRFSDIPRTSHGVVVGSDPECDFVLPYRGISSRHFCLTFDRAGRLVVKDLGSLAGTEVTYGDEGHGKRANFCWIVGGHKIPNEKHIIISVDQTISFHISVPYHDITSPEHAARVTRFLHGAASAEDLFSDLALPNRPGTELPTGTHTPGKGGIFLKRNLGQGSFGSVTHLWDVSTGREFALKEPTVDAARRQHLREEWEREAHIMRQTSHRNIVALLDASFTSSPQLFLEYVPGGSLATQADLSYNEILTVLRQCLSALVYLHGRKPPIVHRDIKPDNILVQYRSGGDIFVKISDFGLSKDQSQLLTICGTFDYVAPEIQLYVQAEQSRYSAVVDVWSLGVVVYELICGLPQYRDEYKQGRVIWLRRVLERFENDFKKHPDRLRQFILGAMVVLSPELRHSAADCYREASSLPSAERGRTFTSNMDSPTEDNEAHWTRDSESPTSNQPSCTIRPKTSSLGSATVPTDEAPPPESQMQAPTITMDQPLLMMSDNQHWVGHEWTYTNKQFKDSLNTILCGPSLASWYRGQGPAPQTAGNSEGRGVWNNSEPTDAVIDEEARQAAFLLQTLGHVVERE